MRYDNKFWKESYGELEGSLLFCLRAGSQEGTIFIKNETSSDGPACCSHCGAWDWYENADMLLSYVAEVFARYNFYLRTENAQDLNLDVPFIDVLSSHIENAGSQSEYYDGDKKLLAKLKEVSAMIGCDNSFAELKQLLDSLNDIYHECDFYHDMHFVGSYETALVSMWEFTAKKLDGDNAYLIEKPFEFMVGYSKVISTFEEGLQILEEDYCM